MLTFDFGLSLFKNQKKKKKKKRKKEKPHSRYLHQVGSI